MPLRRVAVRVSLGALAFVAAAGLAGLGARRSAATVLSGATGAHAGQADAGDVARGAAAADPAPAPAAADPLALTTTVATRAGAVRRTLDARSAGTYMEELLRGRDSSLARWPERVQRPLTVWVQPARTLDGWRPAFADRARDAFAEWARSGVPLRFVFSADSARADVHLTWVDRFDEPISGKTLWARDERWWIVSADIVLALHHRDGSPLDESAVRAIALHEVGHLVGLYHTRDAANIMAPRVRVRDLSAADVATARLLYSVPPGRVR